MANIFERANDWLNSRLKTGGSSTIELTDPDGNTGELQATIGAQLIGVKPVEDIETQHSDKDFTILRADLDTVGLDEPGDGWFVAFGGETFRVFTVEEQDAFGQRIKLRTVRVE